MADHRNGKTTIEKTEQEVLNRSFDEVLQILAVLPTEYTPDGGLVRTTTSLVSLRIDDPGAGVVYIGKAAMGTAPGDALWQIRKIETVGSETTFKYADGDAEFNNVWDNRATTVVYS